MAQFWSVLLMMDLRFFKRISLVWIISLSVVSFAEAQHSAFDPIRDVFKTGSSKEVSKYLNTSVEINVLGEINTYSKAQAEFVLRDFFKKYPISDFAIVHSGSSKSGLQFAIGRYVSNGTNYSVMIRVKEVEKILLIHELAFLKE